MDEQYTALGWRRAYRERLIDWLVKANPNLNPDELFHISSHIREIDLEIAGIVRGPAHAVGQNGCEYPQNETQVVQRVHVAESVRGPR